MLFIKTLQKLLKQELAPQNMNWTLLKGKNKKVIGVIKDELGAKTKKHLLH